MVYHYMYHLKFIKEKFMVCVARGSCGSTVECVTPRLTHTHMSCIHFIGRSQV